ncbi:unnamed protein product [Phytomonas sp. EM1]|nr:unnamed protein product [Phytomonas sp. EM1]|eukprot:CCW65565.1 unnamed protein product [Phytomonas sp. isolate EM1]
MDVVNQPDDHKLHETPHTDDIKVEHEYGSRNAEPEAVNTPHEHSDHKNIDSKHSESNAYGIQRGRSDSAKWDDDDQYHDAHSNGASVHATADNDGVDFVLLPKQDDADVDSEHEENPNASELDMQREPEKPEEDNLEERLQLYSEVLSLRKELDVVKEDEQRLRQQLQNTQMLINEYDPQIEKMIVVLENEAQQSLLRKLWEEQCQKTNPDEMDWSNINIANLSQRVQEARKISMMTTEKVDMLYANRDEKLNIHTDNREQSKAKLKERFEEEMEGLQDLRSRLKQIKDEHMFHQRRGTARAEDRNILSNETKKLNRQHRVAEVENRTSAKVGALSDTLTDLMEECKVLKKQLDKSQSLSDERKNALEDALKKVQEEGSEARDMRQMLEAEQEELSALKADLQGVLHYVRAARREEEIF